LYANDTAAAPVAPGNVNSRSVNKPFPDAIGERCDDEPEIGYEVDVERRAQGFVREPCASGLGETGRVMSLLARGGDWWSA
jgi:hypothetical protein